MDEQLAKDAIAALRALMTNPCISLGDQIYAVREREGEGWDGPAVKAWSAAVMAAENVLKRVDAAGDGNG